MILLPLSFLYQRDKEAVLLWIERLISLELLLLLFSGVWLKNVFQRNQMNVLIMNGTYLLWPCVPAGSAIQLRLP